jgi:hypothetical protein
VVFQHGGVVGWAAPKEFQIQIQGLMQLGLGEE